MSTKFVTDVMQYSLFSPRHTVVGKSFAFTPNVICGGVCLNSDMSSTQADEIKKLKHELERERAINQQTRQLILRYRDAWLAKTQLDHTTCVLNIALVALVMSMVTNKAPKQARDS